MLAVMGVDIGGDQTFEGTGKLPFEPVGENGFNDGSFKKDLSFPCRRVSKST